MKVDEKPRTLHWGDLNALREFARRLNEVRTIKEDRVVIASIRENFSDDDLKEMEGLIGRLAKVLPPQKEGCK
jgi:hypothetical protein